MNVRYSRLFVSGIALCGSITEGTASLSDSVPEPSL